ncbi:MAG: transposase [Pseudanabaena sp. RU_4_16]|nr:transposase [Pseudanabaena sp. RU_4_16]
MVYNPDRHHRRSIRLRGYDYAQAGSYFVTICIHQRRSLLGDICNGVMHPSTAGRMVQNVWDEIPSHYAGIDLDVFVLMPNHIHGIIILEFNAAMKLGDVVHRFKSLTTAKYRHGVLHEQWEPFEGRLWQRNYYEHIIRSEESCDLLRQYIADNPLTWECDRLHPNNADRKSR